MRVMSTREAAERLGLSKTRVLSLLSEGTLTGQKVGHTWLVDVGSVEERRRRGAPTARPFSARVAWAAGALGDGQRVDWLDAAQLTRLRQRLARPTAARTMPDWLRARAVARRYRLAAADHDELLRDGDVVLGGISAGGHLGLGLSHTRDAEIYVDRPTLDRLEVDFFLLKEEVGNLIAHVVDGDWHLRTRDPERDTAPGLIVAADLLDAADTRTRAAGRRLLAQALGSAQRRAR